MDYIPFAINAWVLIWIRPFLEAEIAILKWIQAFACPFLDALMEAVTFLGEQFVAVFVVALVYWCFDKQAGRKLIYILCTSACANGFLKGMLRRPRPGAEDGVRILRQETATGYSFPSGHSQNIAALSGGLAATLRRRWLWFLAGGLMLAVGFTRLYLGAHFPTDVLAGLAFGLAIALLGNKLFDQVDCHPLLFACTCVAFVPGLFLFAQNPIMADFFKAFGLLCGATVGVFLEEKFVQMQTDHIDWLKRLMRLGLGLVGIGVLYAGQKLLYPDALWADTLRYFVIAFYAVGVHPMIIKACKI